MTNGGAKIFYVHADHMGRPIRMTSAAKAVVFTAIYKPYGEVYSTSAIVLQNLRFPGQYFLIETGFAYNWNRFYDPVTGRYTQADPLGLAAGMNRYAYAASSPLGFTDRNGREVIDGEPNSLWATGRPSGTGTYVYDLDGHLIEEASAPAESRSAACKLLIGHAGQGQCGDRENATWRLQVIEWRARKDSNL